MAVKTKVKTKGKVKGKAKRQAKRPPTMAPFEAWLRKQPLVQRVNVHDSERNPVALWLKSIGQAGRSFPCFTYDFMQRVRRLPRHAVYLDIWREYGWPLTK